MNGGIGGFAGPNDLGKPEATLGGYGSGWQGSKKATVEGSLVLTASALVRKKALVPGAQTAGSWGWTYEGEDGPHATIRYEAASATPTMHGFGCTTGPTGRRWTTKSSS